MSVVPGFGGQSFMPSVLDKVEKSRRMAHGKPRLLPHSNGWRNWAKNNAAQCALAGADVLVAGSSTFKAPDMARAIAKMK